MTDSTAATSRCPTAAPTEFDTKSSADGSNGIDDRFPIVTDNGKVFFRDHTGQFGRATLLDTATGAFKTLNSDDLANDSTLTLRGNLFCFFDDDNAAGGRAVYGRLTDQAPTFADPTTVYRRIRSQMEFWDSAGDVT